MPPIELAAAALRKARDTFQRYGDNHLAKTPPQIDKAGVNFDMVAGINATLLALGAAKAEEVFGLSEQKPDSPARERLRMFIESLGERDDDTFVQYDALLGDLRALTKDS